MSEERSMKMNEYLKEHGTSALSTSQLHAFHKRLAYRISSSATGVTIGTPLLPVLPWTVVSWGINATKLWRNGRRLRKVRKEMKKRGLESQVGGVSGGALAGVAAKSAIMMATLGHAEVVEGLGVLDCVFGDPDISYVVGQDGKPLPLAGVPAGEAGHAVAIGDSHLLAVEEGHRQLVASGPLAATVEIANAPTNIAKEAMDVTAAGWENKDAAQLAKEVVVVGAVQAGTEHVVEKVVERPIEGNKGDVAEEREHRCVVM